MANVPIQSVAKFIFHRESDRIIPALKCFSETFTASGDEQA